MISTFLPIILTPTMISGCVEPMPKEKHGDVDVVESREGRESGIRAVRL